MLGSVGVDSVDVKAATERGMPVTNCPDTFIEEVADHALTLLLSSFRRVIEQDRMVREGRWSEGRPALLQIPRLMGQTLGLIGFGTSARAVAQRAAAFSLRLLAWVRDPTKYRDIAKSLQVELVSLDHLLSKSDFVSIHLPLCEETHHLLSRERLIQMKPTAVLINTARGPLIDEVALCDALKSGHLRAAGLDVFEKEPLPLESPLLKLENVLTCGHLGGLDHESQQGTLVMAAQVIIDLKEGRWPTECIRNLPGVRDWRW